MIFNKHHRSDFKYLIPFEILYKKHDFLNPNILILNTNWTYYFKLKIYKNLYIISNGYWFYNLNLGIK